jgi:hypothetical protein
MHRDKTPTDSGGLGGEEGRPGPGRKAWHSEDVCATLTRLALVKMDVTREVSRDERFKLRAKSERRRKMKQQGWLVGWLVVVVAVEMRRAAAGSSVIRDRGSRGLTVLSLT